MNKLEPKHLAPYLPYQLKCKYPNDDNAHILVGLRNPYKTVEKWHLTTELRLKNSTKLKSHVFNVEKPEVNFKPMFRPLSQLTEEIEHNRKRFVPILELEKLKAQKIGGKIISYDYVKESNVARIKYKHSLHPHVPEERQVRYSYFEIDTDPEDITFSLVTETLNDDERYFLLGNELKMYQKLYEWHFDVFGLIEKGLAVDINELGK